MAAHSRLLTERASRRGLPLGYRAFLPELAAHPALVIVHGSSRRAARQFRAFLPLAIRLNVPLVVPTFDEEKFAGYQRLAGAAGPLAALHAVAVTLEDAHTTFGLDTTSVDFFGFSGGAQFVHRFALMEPARVRRLVLASAGWYTFLDPARRFPSGTAPGPATCDLQPDTRAFLRLPLHVLVGERDVDRDGSLRTGPAIDRRQGSNRLTRALRWIDHVEDVARLHDVPSRISFDLLPDSGHSFSEAVRAGGLVERTMGFLRDPGVSGPETEGRQP